MRIGFGAPVSGAWATPQYLSRFAAQAETATCSPSTIRAAHSFTKGIVLIGVGRRAAAARLPPRCIAGAILPDQAQGHRWS